MAAAVLAAAQPQQHQHQRQQHRAAYPNNTTIGDAYFSIDPETHRVVYIADEATARYIGQVLTNLDRPKPQVLIKVVFLEVTRNDASDIGIEGYFNKNLGNSWNSGLVTNYTVVSNNIVPTSITGGQRQSSSFNGTNIFGLPGLPRAPSAAATASIKSSVRITR